MNAPNTNWLGVSVKKLRNSRGPNCEEAIDSTAIVIEKVVPATPNTAPAMEVMMARAASSSPVKAKVISLTVSRSKC